MPNDRYRFTEVHVPGKPLGRHVNHDPASRAYAHKASGRVLVSVRHARDASVGVLDQDNYLDPATGKVISLGSCTGNALTGALATLPLWDGIAGSVRTQLNETYAVGVYSDATKIDSYQGTYPPTDTGSDGLSVAKVALSRGLISGYTHAFSLADALDALQDGPVLTGVAWHTGMDSPDASGLVSIDGAIRGGHEFVADEYNAILHVVGFTNSWGTGYGLAGRFYMHQDDWGQLLADDGDVTILKSATSPAPVPTPVDPDLAAWWALSRDWAAARHVGSNRRAAVAATNLARVRGLL